MIYPCAVIFVAVAIVSFIMMFIIPKFKKIFEDFGTDLPDMTEMLISISDWMLQYWYMLFIGPIGFWLFIKIVRKNKTGAFVVDWLSLRIPLVGKILHLGIIARVTRTLGTLIASGVPILEGLLISRDTSGNHVFERAFDNIYSAIREGETIAVPLKEAKIVDDMVVNMVDVGEETGALDDMLYKVADVYDEEVEVKVESLQNVVYYENDPEFELEVAGFGCGTCGIVITEEARARKKLGGAAGKGIAKAKCPKCGSKMGDQKAWKITRSPEEETQTEEEDASSVMTMDLKAAAGRTSEATSAVAGDQPAAQNAAPAAGGES